MSLAAGSAKAILLQWLKAETSPGFILSREMSWLEGEVKRLRTIRSVRQRENSGARSCPPCNRNGSTNQLAPRIQGPLYAALLRWKTEAAGKGVSGVKFMAMADRELG